MHIEDKNFKPSFLVELTIRSLDKMLRINTEVTEAVTPGKGFFFSSYPAGPERFSLGALRVFGKGTLKLGTRSMESLAKTTNPSNYLAS